MTDAPVPRPKRQGNYYIPERIKLLESEIGARYAAGESCASLAREYGISKSGVKGAVTRQGIAHRGKAEAGLLLRHVCTVLSPEELADHRSIADQLAEKMGLETSKGLSRNRAFQTACTREYRRRSHERYREIDRRRQKALNRIPRWQSRQQLVDFYDMAQDLGLEVDHDIPLQGENICGLNVISNFRLLSSQANDSKQNTCPWTSDPLIGRPRVLAGVSDER